MVPLFISLNVTNLLLLGAAFVLGLVAAGAGGQADALRALHVNLGIFAGLLAIFVHCATFTYFMATTKWLQAATDKADLDRARFVTDARRRKSKTLALCMAAVAVTMLAAFTGAGRDRAVAPHWPTPLHLAMAVVTLAVNALCTLALYRHVRRRRRLMAEALAILNA